MRRITAWITATVAVFALMGSYQLNAAGTTGKSGESQSVSTSATTTDEGAAATAEKPAGTNAETDKPGENK